MSYGHYDVYLTYNGKHACKSFALDLDSALRQAGLNVYLNHDNLMARGDYTVTDTNFSEIEGSRTCIIIFSINFDASTGFLQELEKILERRKTRGLTVVPVFYDVDRSELRHQEGVFARKSWFSEDKAMRYRAALIEVANIMPGFRVWDSMWDFR
ncbi:hypothetical protein TSUD_266340 [Trifolium subterraneum]|uniref:ADP-ribosyl cyclase/cyclic ADP-ribose hydrolase n=1 Tax=Trifolium subterraneum TaxID=3900 RepID=A0A2Z6NRU4_TRISU|nr:hypothetical protein TSUD_266340 [Trifolium subterraneum]